uniref:Uncharacterized protein n=1 Tax=Timema douglasi TaxID=61478 RepID=A0A7R8ZCK8_TIMDO|nr:unnamed protein product [Timema douglasi]
MFSIAVDRVSKYEYKPTEKDLLAEKKLALKKENKYREKLEKQRRQANEKKTHSIHQAKSIIQLLTMCSKDLKKNPAVSMTTSLMQREK